MRIGIIGCGFIGSEIAHFIDKNKELQLIGLDDIDTKNVYILTKKLKNKPKFMHIDELIKKSDLIVESAN